jgi:PAS domain-containing protein
MGFWFDLAEILALAVSLAACIIMVRKLRAASRDAEDSRRLINNLSEGVYRSSMDGRQLSANRALVRLNGYGSEREMLIGVKDIGKEWYVDAARRDEFRRVLTRDGFVEDFISEIYRHATRERIWISENARLVVDHRTFPKRSAKSRPNRALKSSLP